MTNFEEIGSLVALSAVEQAELMDVQRNIFSNNIFEWSHDKFIKQFRLTSYMVDELTDKLGQFMTDARRSSALDVQTKVRKSLFVTIFL